VNKINALIGKTKKPESISKEDFYALVNEAVYKPLESSNALCVCICRRCGSCGEVPKEYVEGLIRTMLVMGQRPTLNLNDKKEMRMHYFITGTCENCHQKGEEVSVQLKQIDFTV